MLEVLNTNYIRTAQAFGVARADRSSTATRSRTRSSRRSPCSAWGSASLMGGAIFVEVIFARTGARDADLRRDPVAQLPDRPRRRARRRDPVRAREPARRPELPLPRSAHPRRGGAADGVPARRDPVPRALRRRRPPDAPAGGRPPPGRGCSGSSSSLLLIVAALSRPCFAPYGAGRAGHPVAAAGARRCDHLLGTDELGRDLLSRADLQLPHRARRRGPVGARGARRRASSSASSPAIVGGMLDNALIVVMDSLQAFPAVILALVLLALLGSSLQNVIIVIAVAFIPNYARVSRALVLALKQQPVRRGGALARRDARCASCSSTSCPTSSRRSSSCSRWTCRARSRPRPASRSSASACSRPRRPGG